MLHPFHLAIPVHDLSCSERFYTEVLGCSTGRRSDRWVDLNFFGHQVVLHLNENYSAQSSSSHVDGHGVPVPHFGVVLDLNSWESLRDRLVSQGVKFVIEPYTRFKGEVGEQGTMFFHDPSGNALEFKGFRDIDAELFAS